MKKNNIYIVTGAPGSGKTLASEELIKLCNDYIVFDIDWLAESASKLVGKSIYFNSETWPNYFEIWSDVLRAIYRNNKTPVLFAPHDKEDVASYGLPEWCSEVEWMLLDCDDKTRIKRLRAGRDWTDERIQEALNDATKLKASIENRIDTSSHAPEEVARKIKSWLDSFQT